MTMALNIVVSLVTAGVILFVLPHWLLPGVLIALGAWLRVTAVGRQAWLVAKNGIATLPQRHGSSAVIIVSIAGVVGVCVALLSMRAGFEQTLRRTGSNEVAIVLSSGAQAESGSLLQREAVGIILDAARTAGIDSAQSIPSAEIVITASLARKSQDVGRVTVRGVSDRVWELRPRAAVIEGRMFTPGLYELVVGRGVLSQFEDVTVGSSIELNAQTWTVVGTFDSGDAHSSEVWGDVGVVASGFRRGSDRSSLTLKLPRAEAIDELRASLLQDQRVNLDVLSTHQFYSRQTAAVTRMITGLTLALGSIMAVGAIFGVLNSMYSVVAARARETATLRAIGFARCPVVVSVMLEAMVLVALGGICGAVLAWLLFEGFVASTLTGSGQFVFALEMPPSLLLDGVKWALAMGFVGAIFPAMRAAYAPVIQGLRDL